ncbi:uncharacterized protein LOC113789182 isoform X1 [Dermatophagoides pteronyssinus]|uniref:uncharacterized protein LOC113789182 isoform X1 n=1 Tax=Dermatophagoides pteronyssinus TaxID=6956 RepID=UPI003F66CEAD
MMKKSSHNHHHHHHHHHRHQEDDPVSHNTNVNEVNDDDKGGGGGGGGKCKKRSNKHHHHHHHHHHQHQQQQQHRTSNKNELKHQKSVTSNDDDNDGGGDGKDELSDSTVTTTTTTSKSTSTSTTIGSSEHDLSNATATNVLDNKENKNLLLLRATDDDDDDVHATSNVTINRLSLMQQQQHKHHHHYQYDHHHTEQLLNRRPSRTLSEPIDDYDLNVRSKAINHNKPHHYHHHQHHYHHPNQSPSSSFHQYHRASVDPYLLEEVARNLGYSSTSLPKHQHQQHQQHYSINPVLKNFQITNCNDNNMSMESLAYLQQQQQQQLAGNIPGGSMFSLNTIPFNHPYHYNNYHNIYQPQQQQQYHQQQQQQQQRSSSPSSSYYRNNNNCCRGSICNDYMNIGGGVGGGYPSISSPYHSNPYFCDSQLHHVTNTTPSSSIINNNGKNSNNNNNPSAQTTEYLVDTINTSPDSVANNKVNNNNLFYSSMEKSSSDDHQQQHVKQQPNDEQQYQHLNGKMEKIIQLESMINILRNQLFNTEDLFKKALISKKSLENANCDLLTIVDKLKLDLIHFESQQKILKEQNLKIENEFEQLKTRLLEKDTEISSLRLTMAKIVRTTGYVLSDNELSLLRGKTIASDYIKNKMKENYHELMFGPFVRNTNYFYSEPPSRRESSGGGGGILSISGGRYSPVAPPRSHRNNNQQQQQQSPTIADQQQQQSLSIHNSPPMMIASSFDNNRNHHEEEQQSKQQPMLRRSTSFENMKMDSQHLLNENINNNDHHHHNKDNKNSFSTLPHNSKAMRQIQRQFELENNHNHQSAITTNPMSQSLIDEEQMMMMMMTPNNNNNKAFSTPNSPMITLKPQPNRPHHQNNNKESPGFGVTFGKKFCWLKKSKRAASAPELAQDDEMISRNNTVITPRINLDDSKPKGLRRIFSRKRSTSSLAGISDSFSRGGLRATSGPRLGFSQEKKFQNVNIPFSNWGTTLVADWFALIGLGMYVNECKRWCKDGEHLMKASSLEVEKELGIKNSLHRKKLRLAVVSMNEEEDDLLKCAGKLDYLWVARWLDDIGLPQYKESFIDARVDGRVLHYLNIEDLFQLKVTNQLHFASIRAAIRVLRENNYNGQCLKRRAGPDEVNQNEWNNSEVAVWSSHRIMEWLRSIDLSEYAPNLRGSGVHGALILYENAFNADLFATLLSIPANKTLLRRHISSKFKQLIGDQLSKMKQEYELMPNYQQLVPGAKIKAYKKGHFTLRKKRADFELTDYVCPMGTVVQTPLTKYSALRDSNIMKNELPSSSSSAMKKEDSPISIKSEDNAIVDRLSLKSESKKSNPIDNLNDDQHLKQNGNLTDNIDERKSDKISDSKSSPEKEKLSS